MKLIIGILALTFTHVAFQSYATTSKVVLKDIEAGVIRPALTPDGKIAVYGRQVDKVGDRLKYNLYVHEFADEKPPRIVDTVLTSAALFEIRILMLDSGKHFITNDHSNYKVKLFSISGEHPPMALPGLEEEYFLEDRLILQGDKLIYGYEDRERHRIHLHMVDLKQWTEKPLLTIGGGSASFPYLTHLERIPNTNSILIFEGTKMSGISKLRHFGSILRYEIGEDSAVEIGKESIWDFLPIEGEGFIFSEEYENSKERLFTVTAADDPMSIKMVPIEGSSRHFYLRQIGVAKNNNKLFVNTCTKGEWGPNFICEEHEARAIDLETRKMHSVGEMLNLRSVKEVGTRVVSMRNDGEVVRLDLQGGTHTQLLGKNDFQFIGSQKTVRGTFYLLGDRESRKVRSLNLNTGESNVMADLSSLIPDKISYFTGVNFLSVDHQRLVYSLRTDSDMGMMGIMGLEDQIHKQIFTAKNVETNFKSKQPSDKGYYYFYRDYSDGTSAGSTTSLYFQPL